jgi:hypothetical protein
MLVIEKSLGTLDTSRGQSTIASAGAVVVTVSVSVDADYDNGATFQGTRESRRGDGDADRIGARPARRRRATSLGLTIFYVNPSPWSPWLSLADDRLSGLTLRHIGAPLPRTEGRRFLRRPFPRTARTHSEKPYNTRMRVCGNQVSERVLPLSPPNKYAARRNAVPKPQNRSMRRMGSTAARS